MITRIISGAIGIALAAYVIQQGGMVFVVGAAVLAVLAWFEFTRAFSHRGGNPTVISGLLGVGGMLYGAYHGSHSHSLPRYFCVGMCPFRMCVSL